MHQLVIVLLQKGVVGILMQVLLSPSQDCIHAIQDRFSVPLEVHLLRTYIYHFYNVLLSAIVVFVPSNNYLLVALWLSSCFNKKDNLLLKSVMSFHGLLSFQFPFSLDMMPVALVLSL